MAPKKPPARAIKKTIKKAVVVAKKPSAAAKKPVHKPSKPKEKPSRRVVAPDVAAAEPALFANLSEGERWDALRIVLDDPRQQALAKVGRYRLISAEPLVVKPPDALAGRRVARVVVYDHAASRCLDAAVDLDGHGLVTLHVTEAQPMLSAEEERYAATVAMANPKVTGGLRMGEAAQAVMHTWSKNPADLAFSRRSAAVLFGKPGARPSLVAVVDLSDGVVTDVVPAEKW